MLNIEELARTGKLFDNRYKLVRPLSTDGGTADVWLATDTFMQDSSRTSDQDTNVEEDYVAIKIYRPKNALDINGEKIFKDEYKIVQNCKHTNLLHPYHFSIFQETPYLELPYCRNGSSEKLIGQALTEKQIWTFIEEVAEGLTYLHALNPPIIHQDIKPANILIDDYGNYAITDFGISATVGGSSNDYSLDDEYSGTMAYMAPERFNENPAPMKESDIWAFGVTLYEILVNNVPFGDYGGDHQLKENRYEPLPKSVPSDVKKLIDNCLNLHPEKRPTADEIAAIAHKHLNTYTSKKRIYSAVAVLCIIAVVAVFFIFVPGNNNEDNVTTTNTHLINKNDSIKNVISNKLIAAREHARIGYEHGEGYVDELMSAKTAYLEIEEEQKKLQGRVSRLPNLSSEKQKLDSALLSARQEMLEKTRALKAVGESGAARQMELSLSKITELLNK